MAKISKEEILKLAHISHIKINEQEVEHLAHELEAVLTYASGLQEIARSYNNMSNNSVVYNIMRDDTVVPCDPEPLLEQAPQSEAHFFIVPKIIKHEGDI